MVGAKSKIWSTVLGWFFVRSIGCSGVRVVLILSGLLFNSCQNSAGLVAIRWEIIGKNMNAGSPWIGPIVPDAA